MADDDANVVSFRSRSEPPSVPLPPLPPAPQPRIPVFAAAGSSGGESGGGHGVLPGLPTVDDMAPPFALAMPGLPSVASDDSGGGGGGDDEGAFAVPSPADPEHPTGRETLQIAIALMTALGVAAAQGMWHRARHRQALADQARANADKATAKVAGRKGSKESSLLRSPGSSGTRSSRSSSGKNRPPKGPLSGSHHGPGRGKGGKAPKADKGGKTNWPSKSKRRKRGSSKDSLGWLKRRGADRKPPKKPDTKAPKSTGKDAPTPKPKAPKKPGGKLRWKAPKRRTDQGSAAKPKSWTSGRPKGAGKDAPKRKGPGKPRAGKLTWKASKRQPGPGGGKAIAGRKRWAARGKIKPVKRRRKTWTKRARKSGTRWLKRWTNRRTGAKTTPKPKARPARKASWKRSGKGSTGQRRRFAGRGWAASAGASGYPGADTPPPPPGFGGMRPPPGADRRAWTTVDSVNVHRRPRPPKANAAVLAAGMPALPPASATKPEPEPTDQQPPSRTDDDVKTGVPYVSVPTPHTADGAIPLHGAQFRDAELTIRDVVEAGEETAEEILAGADTAKRSAAMCEMLAARLEALYAELCELEVPGILIPNVAVLLDKAQDVRGKALAIAEGLPLASEAMRVASANAAVRHQPTADMTRDMGHIKPAERPYHEE